MTGDMKNMFVFPPETTTYPLSEAVIGFSSTIVVELDCIQDQKWNYERVIFSRWLFCNALNS